MHGTLCTIFSSTVPPIPKRESIVCWLVNLLISKRGRCYSADSIQNMNSSTTLRQRTNNKKRKGAVSSSKNNDKGVASSSSTKDANTGEPEPFRETTWDTIKGHWSFKLYLITAFVVVPYGVYVGYHFLLLQRPDIVTKATMGLYTPRPPVRTQDPRQVLIVGTMSSGTSQTAADLKKKLGLEIGHENSDSAWNFVRDGTVSWFHGIRFLPAPDTAEQTVRSLALLCTNFTDSMGFHPRMYRDTGKCSSRQKWSKCWTRECAAILSQEWGCAFRAKKEQHEMDTLPTQRQCETPYARVLHQVRHPVHAIESLVTKFCQGGIDGTVHPSFIKFASALFPKQDFETLSCIEAASVYTVEYNRAIIGAGDLVHAYYRVEDVSPCNVAKMAGFLDSHPVYQPNKEKVAGACDAPDHVANMKMRSTVNRVNEGQLSLSTNDFLGGAHGSVRKDGDTRILKLVRALTEDLGYIFD